MTTEREGQASIVGTRRPRRSLVLAGVTIFALLIAGMAVGRASSASPTGPGVAGSATVEASSTAAGYSARDLVSSGTVADDNRSWRATEGVGAKVDLTWPARISIRQIVLVQDSDKGPRVGEGLLTFGDGSRLLVQMPTRVTVVPVSERVVGSVRLTVTRLASGADVAGLGEILVDGNVPSAAVDRGGARAGDVAPVARVTASPGGDDPSAVTADVAGDPDAGWTTRTGPGGTWIQLDWPAPRELVAVQLAGAQGGAGRLSGGTVRFSDGSSVPVGGVLADARLPTTVAFLPRVVSSLRFEVSSTGDSRPVTIGAIRAFQTGATPSRPAPPSITAGPPQSPRSAVNCAGGASRTDEMTVLCPDNGASVSGPFVVRVASAGQTSVEATVWPSDTQKPEGTPATASPTADGTVELGLDATSEPAGPFTVAIRGTGGSRGEQDVYLQLYRENRTGESGIARTASGPGAAGRTLVYDDEFDRPLSVSRTGQATEYSAAKPVHDGVQDFGDAVFADPASGPTTLSTVDERYLRIGVEPLTPGDADPQGWGRTQAGGMLASARAGGSGFAAQYGYFEARIYAPAARGTWPAFWMLPTDNLVAPTRSVAEIDAVELYGHEPKGACMSTHEYVDGRDGGQGRCRNDLFDSDRTAMGWHTYGVSVGPDVIEFSIDGRVTATAPQVDGGAAPMFFLVDLALGGGWPVDLSATRGRADLYVDYVRVYA